MKSSVVKNNDTPRLDFMEQTVFKPKLQQNAVGHAVVFHWRNPITLADPGCNIGSFELFTADFCYDLLSARRIRKFSVQVLIHAAFVNIHEAFRE